MGVLNEFSAESELEILQDMKKLIDKVDHMTKQRIQLEDKLRDQIQKDDITQILVVASTNINYEVFSSHPSIIFSVNPLTFNYFCDFVRNCSKNSWKSIVSKLVL